MHPAARLGTPRHNTQDDLLYSSGQIKARKRVSLFFFLFSIYNYVQLSNLSYHLCIYLFQPSVHPSIYLSFVVYHVRKKTSFSSLFSIFPLFWGPYFFPFIYSHFFFLFLVLLVLLFLIPIPPNLCSHLTSFHIQVPPFSPTFLSLSSHSSYATPHTHTASQSRGEPHTII